MGLLHDYPEVIISIICLAFYYYYYHFHSPSRTSLVPVNWPIIGMLPAVIAHFHHVHNYMSDALQEAGYTFMFNGPWFFGMDFLITCDPANVHHVFTTKFDNYPKGDDFAEIADVLGEGLFGADGEAWKVQRKMAHGAIGDRALRSSVLAATREKVKQGLVPLLDRVAASGEAVDLENVFSRVTFDITCNMVFGVDPGSLSITFPTIPFADALDDFWVSVLFRHAIPKSWWKLLRWLRLGPEKKMPRANEVIDHFIAHQISRKREERKARSHVGNNGVADLLSYYMDQPFKDVEGILKSEDKFLRDTTVFLMIAGRDAFAIGLSWFFFLLSKNPEVEAKILEELRAHAQGKEVTNRENPMVFDVEDLDSMVYLHGAVCEALRLFAPVPIEHKCALKSDVLPSGHRVDPGTKILLSVYAMGRMEEIWGKDCLEFKPERWILEGGKIRHVPSYKFMVFNSGPRSCLGKEIGLIQLKMVVTAVLWNFKVEVIQGQVIEPKNSAMLRMKNGMRVRVWKRGC